LKPVLLAKLAGRLREPPPDGVPQRGWEALQAIGWSIRAPRPEPEIGPA
jgi:hypothetical protein